MAQELATLCMSDMVRLLGTLGLLSLGITLMLWGLKRRRSGAVVIALFLGLLALVPTVLAIEIPPAGSEAYIQTSGPNTGLNIGDWYTSRNPDAGGPGYHSFSIFIPCTLAPTQIINVSLFDPESNNTGVNDLDEVRGPPDTTVFTLTNPGGVVIATATYLPAGGTSQNWVAFANFTPDTNCGEYRLTTTTSNNDDNAWRLRVEPDNPDGIPNTGDEISLGNLQTSYQNLAYTCQTFHFFVPVTPSIRLNNFDMDVPAMCTPLACTVVYTTPGGTVIPGTASASTVWNNGGGAGYPPPGGDVIPNPEPGWWQATLCMNTNNQYLFDTGGRVYFYEEPATPDMTVSKDDGTGTFQPNEVLNYTITYTNTGLGAALDTVLIDTLPLFTTFISCSGGLSCGHIPPPPGSGIVTFSLGTVMPSDSGSVAVSVRVDPNVPPGTIITNIVELDYTDIVFSDYPPERDTDVDQYEEGAAIELAKTVYLGHNGGVGCPGGESAIGANGADVTYCFEVTNIGTTYLDDITIDDADLGIDETQMTLLSGSTPLAPGGSLVYYYEGNISGDLVNRAETGGNPTDSAGNDLPGVNDPTDDDTAAVAILTPTSEPSEPEEPESEQEPPTPTITPTPAHIPTLPVSVVPTPTVEVLTVERLPETGGLPGWFTVALGVSILIGTAGLWNLALLESRRRRGDGKGD